MQSWMGTGMRARKRTSRHNQPWPPTNTRVKFSIAVSGDTAITDGDYSRQILSYINCTSVIQSESRETDYTTYVTLFLNTTSMHVKYTQVSAKGKTTGGKKGGERGKRDRREKKGWRYSVV